MVSICLELSLTELKQALPWICNVKYRMMLLPTYFIKDYKVILLPVKDAG